MSAGAACNPRLALYAGCTLQVCCRAQSFLSYAPDLPQNATYLAIFGVLLFVQLALGARYRTWGFTGGMLCGLVLEVVGYGGRIRMRDDPFSLSTFLLSFIPIGLGPVFISASIYLTLARLVCTFNPALSRLKPRTYILAFVGVDLVSIIVQAVGGSLTAAARAPAPRARATAVLIAGLAFQAAGLATFIALGADYLRRARAAPPQRLLAQFTGLRAGRAFAAFVGAVGAAALAILVRCIYRVVELCQGFDGPLANAEVPFMVLEGPCVMLAVVLLSVCHPGVVYGARWADADWSLRGDGCARFGVGKSLDAGGSVEELEGEGSHGSEKEGS